MISLSARSRATHRITEEVVIAQRHMAILATSHPRRFDSLVFRKHVVSKAAAAWVGLASGAGLWCCLRLFYLHLGESCGTGLCSIADNSMIPFLPLSSNTDRYAFLAFA